VTASPSPLRQTAQAKLRVARITSAAPIIDAIRNSLPNMVKFEKTIPSIGSSQSIH
jgi:hypothetical protein